MSVLLPQGWVALHLDDRATDEVRRIVTQVMASVAADKRDLARPRLRSMLQNLVDQSREAGVWEVWVPIAATAGIHIPASIAVAPLPRQPSGALSVQDTLLSMSAATTGARATTVGGALAVRTVADRPLQRDDAGEVTAPAARIVNYIVSPTTGRRQWITFTASLFVPDTEDSAQIVEALEFLFDALMASVSFPGEEAPE
ncbi:hypothetical protein ACX3O0_01515 [Homoserinimonas sp. A447]